MKTFKQIICVLLTALMLISVVPFSASAVEAETGDDRLSVSYLYHVIGVQATEALWVSHPDAVAESEDESIVTVAQDSETKDWVITGISPGKTEVYVTRGEEKITLTVKVIETKFLAKTKKMKVGETSFVGVQGDGENAVWESSANHIATVDSMAQVTAHSAGTARITLKQGTLKLSCKVKVEIPVKKTEITSAKPINTKSIQLKWSKVKDADGYKIEAKTSGGSYELVKNIKDTTVTSAKIKRLTPGTVYAFRIKAYVVSNSVEYGTYSDVVKTITIPEKTSFTKVTVKSAHSVSLEWKPVAGATGYLISKKVNGQYVFAKDVTAKKAKTTVVKGLKANKNHSFKIQAYKISGDNVAYAKASKAIKAKTPVKTASSMKFYSKFPQVPNLGFIAGTKCVYDTVVDYKGKDFNMYYYDVNKICICESQWYIEMLEEYGFKYTEKPGLGIKGQTGFVKGNTVVALMADEDYFVVAVVEK